MGSEDERVAPFLLMSMIFWGKRDCEQSMVNFPYKVYKAIKRTYFISSVCDPFFSPLQLKAVVIFALIKSIPSNYFMQIVW